MKKLITILALFMVMICAQTPTFALIKKETTTVVSNSASTAVETPNYNKKTKVIVAEKFAKTKVGKFINENVMGAGKNKWVAAILAWLLGTLGIHSFYMGKTMKGLMQLGLTVLGFALYLIGIAAVVATASATTAEVALPILSILGFILILASGIWALIDLIRILIGNLEPESGWEN